MAFTKHQSPNTNSPIIVCGPTATGKTKLALMLAKKLGGELVSADSRQVYKYMDIGTGKDLPVNSKFKSQKSKLINNSQPKTNNRAVGFYLVNSIRVWMYDVITPDQSFSAYDYTVLARQIINNIHKRNKVAVVVGGTGLYIKALLEGFDTEGIPANWKLREKLGNYEVEKLQQQLIKLSPERFQNMNSSDRNNPRRLIRAIEIANFKRSIDQKINRSKNPASYYKNVTRVGLTPPLPWLYERIDERVENRMEQGMLREIKTILKLGYSWNDPGLNTLGYKQLKEYFQKKITLEEAVQKWKFAEHAYARRQLTWFKKQKNVRWFDVSKTSPQSLISNL